MDAVTEESSSKGCGEATSEQTGETLYDCLMPSEPESLACCRATDWHSGFWRNGSSGLPLIASLGMFASWQETVACLFSPLQISGLLD